MTGPTITAGTHTTMGATPDEGGVNFAVYSTNATQIDLCLFAPDGSETHRLPLPEQTGPIWHGYVPGLAPGALYGLRAHGQYAPSQGHRFNANKLLLDPYARQFHGDFTNAPETYGYDTKAANIDLSFSTSDSAPFMPKCVVPDPAWYDPALGPLPGAPVSELIYEAHAKGLTKLHPDVAEHLKGTYEGLASDAIIDHLHRLGVSTIELLPVQAFIDDSFLIGKALRNYWGYNTIGFFAPEPRYFGPDGLIGFRNMVRKFHDNGIRVILDVVYNHTAEGDQRGPTLSFRGLDNASYYRLTAGHPRYYANDAGTGNTLDIANPHVMRMVTDSLRFWVTQMGIDGFRFDLATTLGREHDGFDPNGGFMDALRQDPVLSTVRLIAEPWDLGPGGYQLGNFPFEFSEWNDSFRDTTRRYWRGDDHSTQELGARLLGSADKFDRRGRRAWASLNFITSHDGFTLADTCAYAEKHNEANKEGNRDGHSGNYSDNFGVEGPTGDDAILTARRRRARNLLATLFLSQGTPMLLAGDEMGNSQAGNNNAYCQDNPLGWVEWRDDADATDLSAFTAKLSAFRRDRFTTRQSNFLHGKTRDGDDLPDVVWTAFDGQPLEWRDPALSRFCLILRASAEVAATDHDDETVVIAFNRGAKPGRFVLPPAPADHHWVRAIDTADPGAEAAPEPDQTGAEIAADAVVAIALDRKGPTP